MSILKKLFGDTEARELKKFEPVVAAINGFEAAVPNLSPADLKNKTT